MSTDFKIGDLITTYYDGIWEITNIIPPNITPTHTSVPVIHREPLIEFKLIQNKRGQTPKRKAKTDSCSRLWCHLVTHDVVDKWEQKAREDFDHELKRLDSIRALLNAKAKIKQETP